MLLEHVGAAAVEARADIMGNATQSGFWEATVVMRSERTTACVDGGARRRRKRIELVPATEVERRSLPVLGLDRLKHLGIDIRVHERHDRNVKTRSHCLACGVVVRRRGQGCRRTRRRERSHRVRNGILGFNGLSRIVECCLLGMMVEVFVNEE